MKVSFSQCDATSAMDCRDRDHNCRASPPLCLLSCPLPSLVRGVGAKVMKCDDGQELKAQRTECSMEGLRDGWKITLHFGKPAMLSGVKPRT